MGLYDVSMFISLLGFGIPSFHVPDVDFIRTCGVVVFAFF